jgi:hypothetical protein
VAVAGLLSVAPQPKYRFTILVELEILLMKRVSPVVVSHIELPNVAKAYVKNNAKTPADIKIDFLKPNREVMKSNAMGIPKIKKPEDCSLNV